MLNAYGYFVIEHDAALATAAVGIAILAAFATLNLFAQARRSEGRARWLWVGAAAVACGTGIWATHFFAMMGFVTGLRSGYHLAMMGCALLVAVGASAAGLALTVGSARLHRGLAGGLVLGLGVGAMHYVGMRSYRVEGMIEWDGATVVLSVALGALFGMLALAAPQGRHRLREPLGTALLAAAIVAGHFTALSAVSIRLDPFALVPPDALPPRLLAVPVAVASLLTLGLALLGLAVYARSRRRALAETERMKSLADAAVEGLLICDGDVIVTGNASFAAMTGFGGDDLAGQPLSRCLPDRAAAAALLLDPAQPIETELVTAGGSPVPVEVMIRRIDFAGRSHRVLALRDLRARKRAEERIRFLAHNDVLTGLPNRALFEARLDDAIASARLRGRSLAVLCLDLDRFKEINDLFGHATGDEALKAVGLAIGELVRGGQTAARLGGDEFAVILPEADRHAASSFGAALLRAFARVDVAHAAGPAIGTSVGVAMFPADGDDRQALLAAADTALYRAKADGRGTLRFYEAGMGAAVRDRRRIEHDLRSAAGRGELSLVYQPQISVGSGDLMGFEALLRWRHPDRGFVSPAVFIPIAEDSGSIMAIGEWVLRSACLEAATWSNPLRVAVNVSAVQLHASGFAAFVAGVLRETGLEPGRLELEVTETALIRDIERALATLRKLKDIGVKIAMDDFGTGYSSLSNLRAFPFDRIKIDGSFIQSVDSNPQAAAIVRAILALGRGLDLPILAEGVETAAELDFLGAEACHEVQGYLLGRPAAIDQFATVVGAAGETAHLAA